VARLGAAPLYTSAQLPLPGARVAIRLGRVLASPKKTSKVVTIHVKDL